MTPCLSGRWFLAILAPFLPHSESFPRLTSRVASALAGQVRQEHQHALVHAGPGPAEVTIIIIYCNLQQDVYNV